MPSDNTRKLVWLTVIFIARESAVLFYHLCPSIRYGYCVKIIVYIVKLFLPSGRDITVVFLHVSHSDNLVLKFILVLVFISFFKQSFFFLYYYSFV